MYTHQQLAIMLFPELINILKVLKSKDLPRRLTPVIVEALIQEYNILDIQGNPIPIEVLNEQYQKGREEQIQILKDLGYSGDTKKKHMNELWELIASVETVSNAKKE